jgi:glycosyltransferase involved in cell wall biosynthesis
MNEHTAGLEIAILIPCLNEAVAIGKVVADFRRALPAASIYVYDNGSTDATVEEATSAGAEVRREPLRGKGNVVRRMFADVTAEVFVLVDGDGTYDAASAPAMIGMLRSQGLDMVCARRVDQDAAAYRSGHRFGNWLLTGLVRGLFGNRVTDILSGYRVMSRRFVKSFPALSSGFETETELTVHALDIRAPIAEMDSRYGGRQDGSVSKLNTFRDGWRILQTIAHLLRDERPLAFFSAVAVLLAVASVSLAVPVIREFIATDLVPRMPTAILSTGLMLVAVMSLVCGLILDTVTRGRRELKRMHYLMHSGVARHGRRGTDRKNPA